MSVRMEDEGPHTAGPEEEWQESVYLAWRDLKSGIGGNHRIGNEANRGTANMWCGVYADGGAQFRHNAQGVPLEPCGGGLGLRCSAMQLFHDGENLRLILDEKDCRLDLTLHDMPGSVAWIDRGKNQLDGRIYSDHYNGHCTVTGTAVLDGTRIAVDGLGWRDHSWGPRKWDSIVCSRSLGGSFGPELSFGFLTFLGTDGTLIRRGHVARHGERIPATEIELSVNMTEDGITARSADVACVLEDGSFHHFEGTVTGGMMGETLERCGFESIVSVTAAGQPEGWGYLEINNNPRLGRTGPVFALHQGLSNGLSHRTPPLRQRRG